MATGNQRSTFETPMMVSVIKGNPPENQTAYSAADMLRKVPGITLSGTGRDRGDIRQSDGVKAPNDESINNVMTKRTRHIDSAQFPGGALRYYNNDAREPKDPQTPNASPGNPLINCSTIQRDAQLRYHLNPQHSNWLNADVTTYWSEVRINTRAPDIGGEAHIRALPGQARTPAGQHKQLLVVDDMTLPGFGISIPQAVLSLRQKAEQLS